MKSRFDRIENKLNEHDKRFDDMNSQFSTMSSRMRELEANVHDISSIKGAVNRMGVGFQKIPYEMSGRAAVEEINEYEYY